MDLLLLFFAIPVLVIIVSIILQKILDNPILVASLVFAVFLVITFIIGNTNLLIATLVYSVVALITAVLVKLSCCFRRIHNLINGESNEDNSDDNNMNEALVETINNNTNNNICKSDCRCSRFRRF